MPRVITISGSAMGSTCETAFRKCLKRGSRKRCLTRLAKCSRKTGERTRRPPGVRLGAASSCKLPTRAGQTITISAHGKKLNVKRVRKTWFLKIAGSREHARWADFKKDACEDVAHFREVGALPRGQRLW